MNEEALKQLRRVVADAPYGLFDMGRWSVPTACGTAHCAAGWARLDPWHQENTAIYEAFWVEEAEDGDEVDTDPDVPVNVILSKIYGVSLRDAVSLFYDYRATRADFLENVDRLLAGLPPEKHQRPNAETRP